jgi:hypothetical protein
MLSFRRFEALRRLFALRFSGCERTLPLLRAGLLAPEMVDLPGCRSIVSTLHRSYAEKKGWTLVHVSTWEEEEEP